MQRTGNVLVTCLAVLYAGLSGSSPTAHLHKQLSRMSFSRHRHQLHARAVASWLHKHPAAARSVERLIIDLTHHSHHDFDRQQLEALLQALPRLHCLHMSGAIDGTDAYEPLGGQVKFHVQPHRLRHVVMYVACILTFLMAPYVPTVHCLCMIL